MLQNRERERERETSSRRHREKKRELSCIFKTRVYTRVVCRVSRSDREREKGRSLFFTQGYGRFEDTRPFSSLSIQFFPLPLRLKLELELQIYKRISSYHMYIYIFFLDTDTEILFRIGESDRVHVKENRKQRNRRRKFLSVWMLIVYFAATYVIPIVWEISSPVGKWIQIYLGTLPGSGKYLG